jgi:hypothetical protein
MRAGRTTVVAVLAGLGLLTAGCNGNQQNAGPAGTPSSAPSASSGGQGSPDQHKVDFADDICGAVSKFMIPATSFKPDTSSPAAAVNSLKTQLGGMSTGLGEANEDLKKADTSGVPDGQAAVDDLQKTFGQMKEAVDRTKTKLDAVNPNDTQAVAAAVQQAGQDLSSLGNMQNPLDQPNLKSADMEAAAEQAPKCQQIKSLIAAKTGGTSSAPTS